MVSWNSSHLFFLPFNRRPLHWRWDLLSGQRRPPLSLIWRASVWLHGRGNLPDGGKLLRHPAALRLWEQRVPLRVEDRHLHGLGHRLHLRIRRNSRARAQRSGSGKFILVDSIFQMLLFFHWLRNNLGMDTFFSISWKTLERLWPRFLTCYPGSMTQEPLTGAV